jgi:hypothetical protein
MDMTADNITPETLDEGIVWINGNLKVSARISDSGTSYVQIHPDHPNTHPVIQLTLNIGTRIEVLDLNGNGYFSGLQGRGYGRLALNIAIELLTLICPPDIVVTGHISDQSDPDDRKAKAECFIRRQCFWTDAGFTLKEPHSPTTYMSAKLSELNIRPEAARPNSGLLKRTLDLDEFWLESDPPVLQPGDKFLITEFCPSSFPELPDEKELIEASRKVDRQLRQCMISCWLCISFMIFSCSYVFWHPDNVAIGLLIFVLSVALAFPFSTFANGFIAARLRSIQELKSLRSSFIFAVSERAVFVSRTECLRGMLGKRLIQFITQKGLEMPDGIGWIEDCSSDLSSEDSSLLTHDSEMTPACKDILSKTESYFNLLICAKNGLAAFESK